MPVNVHGTYGLRRVINAAGTMTYLGASCVSSRVIRAMNNILPEFVEMRELQSAASRIIAKVTNAEAGCVTASSAAGISIAVASCMTGTDLYRIEQLPDTRGMKNEVIVQKGHSVSFGASLSQMIRLAGASCVEIGSATQCGSYQLRGAIGVNTAAVVFVVSHHTVQSGLLGLHETCEICAEHDVPVIVDAASEYDLTGFLATGAQVAIYSGHKFLGGPTSGIIAGDLSLIRACYMQEKGIGRGMKAGKESVVGVMEALEQWLERDATSIRKAEEERITYAHDFLNRLVGISTERIPDPTFNPITRLQVSVDPNTCPITAFELIQSLSAGDPTIRVRSHEVELGHFQIDACNLRDGEIEILCERIEQILQYPNKPKTESKTQNAADLGYLSLLRWPD